MTEDINMLAYHNDPAIKTAIITQLETHRVAEQLIKGRYWEKGKGCAIGCTVHSGSHKLYESRFGIPEVLVYLEDRIFEGLPNDSAMEWPVRFMGAIEPGSDLSMIWPRFALWLLTAEVQTKNPQASRAAARVAELYQRWVAAKKPLPAEWNATSAAASAACAAYATYAASAGASAAYAAYATYAAYSRMADKLIELIVEAARSAAKIDALKRGEEG